MVESYIFGETRELGDVSVRDMQEIIDKARELKKRLATLEVDQIIDVLNACSQAWSDQGYKYRRIALEELPSRIKFSREMVEEGIKTLCSLMSRDGLTIRLNTDLGNKNYLNRWTYNEDFKGYIKAIPRGIIAHVSAGNVFVGGVDSLVQGIITKNVNIMKMSTADPIFPVLFAKSLKEFDDSGILHQSMALLNWKGGTASVENVLKRECDAIVVYGGSDTVYSYRENQGLHCKLVEYGPKYSFVVVEKREAEKRGIQHVARAIARDAIMWEQSACSSPHVVYVETEELARIFVTEIGKALDEWAEKIPQGSLFEDEAVEITRVREMAKVEKALGNGDYYFSKNSLSTVVYQRSKEFTVSNHNRTLFVKYLDYLDEVVDIVEPMGQFIQTVSLITGTEHAKELADKLSLIGADRFVDAGKMAVRKHGTPHDGTKGLSELIKWVSLARDTFESNWDFQIPRHRYDPGDDSFDRLPDARRAELSLNRLKSIVEYAREHSPLLRERYKDIDIETLDDITRLPLMTGEDYKRYLPPNGQGLLTSDLASGFVFSSGGTTGQPKSVYRTFEEQWFNAMKLGKGLRLSIFGEGDVVANLLFAGNMWASFVSYNMALEYTGCRILPIGGNLHMEDIINNMLAFKATGFITIPSVALSIAEYVDKNNVDLHIEKVVTGGEHLFKEAKEYLRKVLGVKKFASTGYTTNDTGAIGYQCEYLEGGFHHVHEDLHYVEILDEDGNPCKNEQIGRIVVTNLQRKLMPTIRYDVGDLGRWIEGECQCGRKTRIMELLGRSDDVLIIGGGNIHPEVIAESLYEVEGLSNHFQLIGEIFDKKDRLRVKVEALDSDLSSFKDKESEIKRIIYEKSKELRSLYGQGLIHDIVVEIVKPNTIERNPKTGKIRLVIDQRS